MPKQKLTEEQKEMLELLPNGLPKMSNATKLVLANIILWYGTDYGREHDCVYRTNEDMAQNTGLSKQTVIASVRNLELLGLIERNRGQRGQASVYYLTDEIKQKIYLKSTEIKSKPKEMVVKRNSSKGQIKETMGQITKGQMTELIGQITNAVCERMNEIITLKFNELYDVIIKSETQGKKAYLTTESETDVDIEILDNIRQDIESKPESSSTSENNDYVSNVFDWLDNELDNLYKVKDFNVFNEMESKIAQYMYDIDQSKFSEKQWEVVDKKLKRWEGIEIAKYKYFNRQRNNKSDDGEAEISKDESTNDEYGTVSVNLIDSLSDNEIVSQTCGNISNAEAIEWVSNDVKNYVSYKSWEEDTWEKFNQKYGENWSNGNDANACRLYNVASSYAQQYFRDMQTNNDQETISQGDDEDLAPWEVPFVHQW